MTIQLTKQQFRRLLDMVYLGNIILNATRGTDRIPDYDNLESLLFKIAKEQGMDNLSSTQLGEYFPSLAFREGGIHLPLMEYESIIFFDMLAEDLTIRDMNVDTIQNENFFEFLEKIQEYYQEFEEYGVDRLYLHK